MTMSRESKVQCRAPKGVATSSCSRLSTFGARRGFTLLEIMVVVGIMAVILTISVPFMARQMHRDSMRQAVTDVMEMCSEARNRAVLEGRPMQLRIDPASKTFSVAAGTAATTTSSGSAAPGANDAPSETGSLVRKLSEHIILEYIEVNMDTDLQLSDQCGAMFYPNGTSDVLGVVLRSDLGEVRVITTDPVTGVPDVDTERRPGK